MRALGAEDRDDALELCSRDIAANVFVAARILEGTLESRQGCLLGHRGDAGLDGLCWASANVVPVGLDGELVPAFADRLRKWRSRVASVLGPSEQVAGLWSSLEPVWGRPRAIRERQPLMGTRTPPSALGVALDPRVRPATRREVDLVLPAAAHMFTGEIGYAPYSSSPRHYRSSLAVLVERGQTYVIVERGRVVFKADVGSVALGCAQVQGVWVAPDLRGQGLAAPAMAATVEQIMLDHDAPFVTLYVNDFNAPARATYRRIGMTDLGVFSTVLL